MKKIITFCFLILALSSCAEQKISKNLKEFFAKQIVFPESMIKVKGKEISDIGNVSDLPKLVIFNDSLSCS